MSKNSAPSLAIPPSHEPTPEVFPSVIKAMPDHIDRNEAKLLANELLEHIVATNGATLLTCPLTPALRCSIPDLSFSEKLTSKLNTLVARQDTRINMYSQAFAEEWPISRTPRDLAKQVAAHMRRIYEEGLHLESDSESESEDERARKWRNIRIPETRKNAVKTAKRVGPLAPAVSLRLSQQSNLKCKRSDIFSPPRSKTQRVS